MKKVLVTLVLILVLGYSDSNSNVHAKVKSLDTTHIETVTIDSNPITPFSTHPHVDNPNLGGTPMNFSAAMGRGAKTTKHSTSTGRNLQPDSITPSSSQDLISGGAVKQRRYYDANGKAIKDIDYFHTDDGTHTFPHIHYWNWHNTIPRGGAFPAQF